MDGDEFFERYEAGERDFSGVDLSGIDFGEFNPSLTNIIN